MRMFFLVICLGLGTVLAPAAPVTLQTVAAPAGFSAALRVVRFERHRTALRVIELPPGATVAEGARHAGALAAVNGGYFQRDGTPLGLVVSGGKTLHPAEASKILTGVLVVTPWGATLLRTAEFRPGGTVREALQAGPFLVDRGRPVPGLNATRRAERTVLVADRKGVTALVTTEAVTLAELGNLLAVPGLIEGVTVERALNLDGGTSTALWVWGDPPVSRPEWKPVRNAVAVVPLAP